MSFSRKTLQNTTAYKNFELLSSKMAKLQDLSIKNTPIMT